MKKFVSILLLAALMLSQTAFVPSLPLPPASISGFIADEDEGFILVESGMDGSQVHLYLEERPRIVDCVSGLPMSLDDRIDDKIIAYYGPATTRSIPPQSNAVLIICNIPEGINVPSFGRVEAVDRSDDEINVTLDGGGLIVNISRDTPISPFFTREIVTIDTINVGDELLMWYPIVAMSFPAQAIAVKVVRLGRVQISGETGATDIMPSYGFSQETLIENETTFVPLRTIAEALGYVVSWDNTTKSVTLNKDGQIHRLTIGVNEFDGHTLEAAPLIRDDRTYVPFSYIELVLGIDHILE